MKNRIILLLIIGGIAIGLALISLLTGLRFASILGVISTITSILLSVIAMLYTFFSGEKTLNLLNQMEAQYKNLVAKINQDLLRDAYDEMGIKVARKDSFEKLHKSG